MWAKVKVGKKTALTKGMLIGLPWRSASSPIYSTAERQDGASCLRVRVELRIGEWSAGTSRFSNPQPNPQNLMSCTTSANFGSPRGLLSRCKT